MRVPTRSDGTRSGVNWTRANVPPRTPAVVLIVSVLASPGTPSISRWPCASRHTRTRSSIASCPAITRLISKSACSRRSCASPGKDIDCSFTLSPSFARTESYTTAAQSKFLLRAIGFVHDHVPRRAHLLRRAGPDGGDRQALQAAHGKRVPGDHLASQSRRRRRGCQRQDVLHLRGTRRGCSPPPRRNARVAPRGRHLRNRRGRHSGRFSVVLGPPRPASISGTCRAPCAATA